MPDVKLTVERVPASIQPIYDGHTITAIWQNEEGIWILGSLGSSWIADWNVWSQEYWTARQEIRSQKLTECPENPIGYSHYAFAAARHELDTLAAMPTKAERQSAEEEAYRASKRKQAADAYHERNEQQRVDEIKSRVDLTAITLWPHQERTVPIVFSKAKQGVRRILLVGPTGMGKMVLAAWFMAKTSEAGRRSLFLADIRELIGQCKEKLHQYGVDAGVVMALSDDQRNEDLAQVASKDTLWRRAFAGDKMEPPLANLLLVDEAHKSRALTWARVIEHYKDAVVLGFTATPCRQDGRGLGALWDEMVVVATYKELREAGVIVPAKVYAPTIPNLKGCAISRGDYVMDDLRKRMDRVTLVGDIVKDWRRRADGRPTVVFASGINHSIHIRNQFQRHGILCEHVDSVNTNWEQRQEILGRLHDGNIQVVTNFGVLTTGWDEPAISCMICARPTRSLSLWRQMAGRVLRAYPGKEDAIILDHSGAVFRHGYPDDDIEWELGEDKNIHVKVKAKLAKEAKEQKEPYACPKCAAVYRGPECPGCGYKPTPHERAVRMTKGELKEVTREQLNREHSIDQKEKAWFDALGWAIGSGKTTGAAAHRYKTLYGVFPPKGLKRMPRGKRQWNMDARDFYNEFVIPSEQLGLELYE